MLLNNSETRKKVNVELGVVESIVAHCKPRKILACVGGDAKRWVAVAWKVLIVVSRFRLARLKTRKLSRAWSERTG
jgi:hypothetical protein